MSEFRFGKLLLSLSVGVAALSAWAAPQSRGSIVVYPVVFDKTGTTTSRTKASEAIHEVLKKGGFKVMSSAKAATSWASLGYRTPSLTRPPSAENLASLGKAVGANLVCTAQISFNTRSIGVNLGPKTISTCQVGITIVDSRNRQVVYEADAEGRSDEKTDSLKVAGALLISPLVTVVSGGPKTPQETRAAQIAIARSLEKFVVVEDAFVGKWEFVRFDGMDDSVVTMKDPKLYTLEISDDGTISGRVEVNRFNGSYTSDGPSLKFDLKAMTMAAPMDPNSYHDKYLNHLGYVRSYVLRDNQLFLSLEADGGIMVFRRANSK